MYFIANSSSKRCGTPFALFIVHAVIHAYIQDSHAAFAMQTPMSSIDLLLHTDRWKCSVHRRIKYSLHHSEFILYKQNEDTFDATATIP